MKTLYERLSTENQYKVLHIPLINKRNSILEALENTELKAINFNDALDVYNTIFDNERFDLMNFYMIFE